MLDEMLKEISTLSGRSEQTVFVDLVHYCVASFDTNIEADDLKDWPYDGIQNEIFSVAKLRIVLNLYFEELQKRGWSDVLGSLYQKYFPGTPLPTMEQCELLARSEVPEKMPQGSRTPLFGTRPVFRDPVCRSGRGLIAIKKTADNSAGWSLWPYLVGQDTDPTFVRITALNLILNGCFGEAVLLDDNQNFLYGYISNEDVYRRPEKYNSTLRLSYSPADFYTTTHRNQK